MTGGVVGRGARKPASLSSDSALYGMFSRIMLYKVHRHTIIAGPS